MWKWLVLSALLVLAALPLGMVGAIGTVQGGGLVYWGMWLGSVPLYAAYGYCLLRAVEFDHA
jgi:hypothetical protein